MEERYGNYVLLNRNEVLGEGSYAKVYEGYHCSTQEKVAIKIIAKKPNENPIQFLREKEIWKTLNHPNVVKLYHEEEKPTEFVIVMEYLKGELNSLIMQYAQRGGFPEPMARYFLCQLAAGLEYLHAKGIVHRDLKPQNLLLTSLDGNAQLKIADFGFARHEQSLMHSMLGTPLYMAPELFENKVQYTSKVDIWSAGLIFWQMLTGQQPWIQATNVDHLKHILKQKYLPDPPNASHEAIKLLHQMVTFEQSRMSWEEFCNCAYLKLQRGLNVSVYNHADRWTQEIISFEHSCTHVFAVSSKDMLMELQYQFEDMLKIPHNTLVFVESDGKRINIDCPLGEINVSKNCAFFAFYASTIDADADISGTNSVLTQFVDLENRIKIPEMLNLPSATLIDQKLLLKIYETVLDYLSCYEKAASEILLMKNESESQVLQLRAWRVLTTLVLNQQNSVFEVFKCFIKKFEHYKLQIKEILSKFPEAVEKLKNSKCEMLLGSNMTNFMHLTEYKSQFEELKIHFNLCLEDEKVVNSMINDLTLENIMDFALNSFCHYNVSEEQGEKILKIHLDLKSKLNELHTHLVDQNFVNDDATVFSEVQVLIKIHNDGIKMLKNLQAAMDKLVHCKEHNSNLYASLLKKAKIHRHKLLSMQQHFQEDMRFESDKNFHSSIPNLLLSLYKIILLPSWINQVFKEAKRRVIWKYQVKKRATRFQNHLQGLWEKEKITREKFHSDLDPQIFGVLGSAFTWPFSTSVQPDIKVVVKMNENLPQFTVDESFNQDILKLPDPILSDFEQLKQSYLLSQLQNQALIGELNGFNTVETDMAKLKVKIKSMNEEINMLILEKKKLFLEKNECLEKLKNALLELGKCKEDLKNSEQICNDLLIKSVTI